MEKATGFKKNMMEISMQTKYLKHLMKKTMKTKKRLPSKEQAREARKAYISEKFWKGTL